ncbi:MAG: FecR domain-containing protein [Gammaproteobacteria bacterium]|nr:FecR domain-containing protein [Gammaproteobacteria bacterium]MCP5196036.1 FecR domain-containing protein [Gammaproteobacteria bacterium]
MLRLGQWFAPFVTLWLWVIAGYAEYPVDIAGYVTRIRSEAVIENAAGRYPLMLGQPLHIGDRVMTGSDARLEARMRDGTVLTLGANTEFVVRQIQGVTSQDSGSLFELFKGVFRAATAQTDVGARSREDWRVRTPVATIGIRGTELWGGFNLLGAGANTLDVVMLKGKGVYVESIGQQVELNQAGEGTTVAGAGRTPGLAKTWEKEKLQAAQRTVTW